MTQLTPNDDSPRETGYACIAGYLKGLETSPGVYRMLDAQARVLYVGKARNLRARVSNYARPSGHSGRIERMIGETASMMFLTTRTETEALLLEQNLIKQLKPKYNVLLRDDKSFPNILVAKNHDFPQIKKHRGAKKEKGAYFGPFASAGAVNRTLNQLQKAFLLRNCSDSYYEGRTRPCLQHQIKRCAAPCTGEVSIKDYNLLVGDAVKFLSGKSKSVQTQLSEEMMQASEEMDFERAALLRDRIAALSLIQSQGDMSAQTVADADIFAIHQEAGKFCIQVFFFRAHQNWGNRAYYPRADKSLDEKEVLTAFIAQFYEARTPAKLVLLSHPANEPKLLSEALSLRADRKVEISTPQRGEKRTLVEHALNNARQALGRQLSETASQAQLLEGMAKTFDLEEPPRRIEVYDNSHIQGTNAVGAMIVAGREGFSKKHYRTFNIKSTDITPGDDFGMMREVLTRRFTRLINEFKPEDESPDADKDSMPEWPDILLIDGGKGQISAVKATLSQFKLPREVTIIGIAKGEERNAGRETFILEGKEPFMLPARDPVLYYVQRLRDEAHRFAIGTHRAKRSKQIVKNPLDEIEGIGPSRKKALLSHFGSAKAVGGATVKDLQTIPGISKTMAQNIYDHFNRS